jgi:hypothetical protein
MSHSTLDGAFGGEPWLRRLRSRLEQRSAREAILLLRRGADVWSGGDILDLSERMLRSIKGEGAPSCVWICDGYGAMTVAALLAFEGASLVLDEHTPGPEVTRLANVAKWATRASDVVPE